MHTLQAVLAMIPKGFMLKDSNVNKNTEGILMWIGGRKDSRRMS